MYLILELCKGGELFDRIVAEGTFSERKVSTSRRSVTSIIWRSMLQSAQEANPSVSSHTAGGEILSRHGGGHPPLPSAGRHPPVCLLVSAHEQAEVKQPRDPPAETA